MRASLIRPVVAALLMLPASLLCAEEVGITVSAVGEASALPDRMEMFVTTSGSDNLAEDAITKYRDSLRRTVKSFEDLKLANLKIEQQGLGYSTDGAQGKAAMFGPDEKVSAAKSKFTVARRLRIVLTGIDKMPEAKLTETIAKLIDRAKETGSEVGGVSNSSAMMMAMMGRGGGSSSVVTFAREDTDALRALAYKQAIAKVRRRAERLAELSGARLGPVLSITTLPAVQGEDQNAQMQLIKAMYGISEDGQEGPDRVTSDKFELLKVRVNLRVRFALERGK